MILLAAAAFAIHHYINHRVERMRLAREAMRNYRRNR